MEDAAFAPVAVVVVTPALAEDGSVSNTTLESLGLNDLQQMTDVEGSQVRGKLNGNGGVIGTSLISFQLLTPDSQNFVHGSSVNTVIGIPPSVKLVNPFPRTTSSESVRPLRSASVLGLAALLVPSATTVRLPFRKHPMSHLIC